LSQEEFRGLRKAGGKKLHKIRYYYDYNGKTAEIDVFQAGLKGLVMVDIEFRTAQEKDAFAMPPFCLADVTQERFAAGGMLCGKSYRDIEQELKKFRYRKLFLK
jgi:CYTH domain-containing protein